MRISILHPSRGRPAQAQAAFKNWVGNCSKKMFDVEYILSLDTDDKSWAEYIWANGLHIIYNDNNNLVEAANKAAAAATGDILVLISDDFISFPGWDQAIVKALEGQSGVLKTYDGVQKWIVTLPILTADYYKAEGHFYDPLTRHMFCDTIMTHKADITKKLIVRNNIVFKHNHYSIKGGQPKDQTNARADSTWAQGEAVYLQRCREWKAQGLDLYNLSPEAIKGGHVNWLKKKLR
jgi:glycosyltransferase involved in cell wall biosynthesis